MGRMISGDRIARWLGRVLMRGYNDMEIQPFQEHTYRYFFTRDMAQARLDDEFYPVGARLTIRCFIFWNDVFESCRLRALSNSAPARVRC